MKRRQGWAAIRAEFRKLQEAIEDFRLAVNRLLL